MKPAYETTFRSIFRTWLPAPGAGAGGVVVVAIATLVAAFGSWNVLNPIALPLASVPTGSVVTSKSSTSGRAAAAAGTANDGSIANCDTMLAMSRATMSNLLYFISVPLSHVKHTIIYGLAAWNTRT